MQSTYIVNEVVNTQVTTETTSSQQAESKQTVSWEQYSLLNSEVERLSILNRTLNAENETLKHKFNSQNNLIVENERLQREVETLKLSSGRITDLEARIALLIEDNKKLSGFSVNKEVVVSTELNDLKSKLSILAAENERVNILLADRTIEIESLKYRLSQVTEVEYNLQIALQEKEKLNAQLTEKVKEINSLKSKTAEISKGVGSSMTELKTKLTVSLEENDNLNFSLVDRAKEIEALKTRLSEFIDMEYRLQVATIAKENLEIQVTELTKEMSYMKVKLTEVKQTTEAVSQANSQLATIVGENTRLTNVLAEKGREIESLKFKVAECNDLEARLILSAKEKENLGSEIADKQKDINALKVKVAELEKGPAIIADLKAKIALLVSENESLNSVIIERSREIESLKIKIIQSSDIEPRLRVVIQEKEAIADQLIEKLKEVETLKTKIVHVEREATGVSELKDKISSLRLENQKLTTESSERLQEINVCKQKLAVLPGMEAKLKAVLVEKDKLKILATEKSKEVEAYATKVSLMQNEYLSVGEYNGKVTRMVNEIERLGTILAQKEKELVDLRMKAQQLILTEQALIATSGERDKYAQEFKKAKLSVAEKSRQIDILNIRCNEADVLAEEFLELNREKAKLEIIIAEKSKEISTLNSRVVLVGELEDRLEGAEKTREHLAKTLEARDRLIAELRVSISVFDHDTKDEREFQNQINLLTAENKRLNESLSEKTKESSSFRTSHHNSLELRIASVMAERDQLHAMITEKLKEIESLRIKVIEMGRTAETMYHLEAQVNVLTNEVQSLHTVILEKTETIKEWETKYGVLEKLYLSVKEATEQLQLIKRKYQEAVLMTEQEEPKLRLSVDSQGFKKTVTFEHSAHLSQSQMTTSSIKSPTTMSLQHTPKVKGAKQF